MEKIDALKLKIYALGQQQAQAFDPIGLNAALREAVKPITEIDEYVKSLVVNPINFSRCILDLNRTWEVTLLGNISKQEIW